MNTSILTAGTRVQCTAHEGHHKGTVRHVAGDGTYGIAWDDFTPGVPVPKHFSKGHWQHMSAAPADAVEQV